MKIFHMMNQVYYLKTCDTCKRILKELDLPNSFELIDIKEHPLTVSQLDALHRLTNSYEVLFSKRAKLYKEMGLKDQNLEEKDFRYYLLDHYTFLKRPVVVFKNSIFIGNSKKNIASAKAAIHND